MIQLLVIRDKVKELFGKYAYLIMPILRFFIAFSSFLIVNNQIGYNEKITNITIVIGLSVLSAFLPFSVTVLFAAALTIWHIYSASMFLSAIFILIITAMYFLFVRFAPGYGLVVLAFPILYFFHLELLVPLVLGIVGTPIAVFAIIPSVITAFLFSIVKDAVKLSSGVTQIEDNLQNYIYVVKALTGNKLMVLLIVSSICVLVVTYVVRKMTLQYSKEVGILSGVIMNLIIMIVGGTVLNVEVSILWVIFGTLFSGILAYIIQFFMYILDYTATEHLQFDDEDYYYYVTAVPKLSVTSPNLNILKINEINEKHEMDEPDLKKEND